MFRGQEIDPEYLAQARAAQRNVVAVFCGLGASFALFSVLNAPMVAYQNAIRNINFASLLFSFSILSWYAVTKTALYLTSRYIELPLLILVFSCEIVLALSIEPAAIIVKMSILDLVCMHFTIFVFACAITCIGDWKVHLYLSVYMLALVLLVFYLRVGLGEALFLRYRSLLIVLMIAVYANFSINRGRLLSYRYITELNLERSKVENLLYNVLPEPVAQRMQRGETIADAFFELSIIFIDIVGFSGLSKQVSPKHLLDLLNKFFLTIDECADEFQVEKVKAIGDAYLGVVGAHVRHDNPADSAILFARAVLERVGELSSGRSSPIQVRIGIHTGSVIGGVIGGVIGERRKTYDFWGESMNIASRIQGAAEPDTILISESTYLRADTAHHFAEPLIVILKGLGEAKVYQVVP